MDRNLKSGSLPANQFLSVMIMWTMYSARKSSVDICVWFVEAQYTL